jgi:hypothetical protein
MCHIRNMQSMSSKLAPSLQKKIHDYHGNSICSPRNLLPSFNKAAREEKILKTQYVVQQAVNRWQEIRDTIDLLRTNKNLSKALSPQETFISNQNLDDAFILEPEDVAAFRSNFIDLN